MKLIESIASYTGESRRRMQQVLTADVKDMIAKVSRNQLNASEIDCNILKELIEMDVFRDCDGQIKPYTAIFFEEDIEKLYNPIFVMGERLADIVICNGTELENSSPNIRNFIGSIMGMGQGLHSALKSVNLASNWQNKTGKYEKCKVDFNQECQVFMKFGEDLQIKRVHRGNDYTSVVIGPGTDDYCSYIWNAKQLSSNSGIHEFYDNLVTYLTDAIPLLLMGKIQDESLEKVALNANIDIYDKSSVITCEESDKYHYTIKKISDACTEYFLNNIEQVKNMLTSTIVGQQGAPFENMMMNLWRYLRKAVAIKLYENGFLNDKVPVNGSITVFYENGIDYF